MSSASHSYRESLLALLAGETPDGPVWTADITYWITGRKQDGSADPGWDTEEGYLGLHRDHGVMPYYWYPDFWLGRPEYDDTVTFESGRDGHRSFSVIHTPVGDLRTENTYLPESCSSATTRYAVQNGDDLETLLYLLEHRTLSLAALPDYFERLVLWRKYDGLPSIALPRHPVPAFFYEWAGLMNATYLLMDREDDVREVFDRMEAEQQPIIDAVCERPVPLVHFADNLSSDNLTSFYDEYMEGPYRRRIEKLHGAGVKAAVHLDGVVRGLLPRLAAVGIDAIEALTPHPAGDVDSADMRAVADSDTVILWGGVPGAMFSPPWTWEQMEAHVAKTLECWSGTPFVLGVADQVPPDGDITFCERIADMVRGA